MTGDGESTRLLSEYIQDVLSTVLGIKVNVSLKPSKQRWADERAGAYELNISGYTGDGTIGFSSWETGGNYYKHTGFVNQSYFQEFQDLVNKFKYEVDPVKASEYAGQAEQLILDHAVFIPIYHGTKIYLLRDDRFQNINMDKAGMEVNYIFAEPAQ